MRRMITKINLAGELAKTLRSPFSGKLPKRVISMLLCLCITATLLCNLGGGMATFAQSTQNYVSRIADGDTMDTYQGKLLTAEWGSRYAGRVWTDKSVFAYGTDIELDNDTDGYVGGVHFDSDFGTAFSALASSQRINEYPPSPIDLVILIDMSGSMASDIVDPDHTHNDYNQPNSQRISHSRIYAVLESINKTIKEVMEMGDADRVAVVAYGATAYTLMELGHYKTPTDGKYLEVKNFRCYYSHYSTDNHAPYTSGSASYMVGTVDGLQKLNDDGVTYTNYGRYARNDYKNGKFSCDPVGTRNIGYHTDLQAGIYQGFEELYKRYNSKEDVTKTYESQETGNKTVVQRIPVAIVMTDGGSNYALKPTSSATGDEWYNVPIYDNDVTDYGGAWKKYRTESSGVGHGGDATILDILMTASYEKSKVQKKYEKYVLEAKADKDNPLEEERFKGTDFRILTVSVDTPHDEWQKPRVYAALDPVHFFNDNPQVNNEIDPDTWDQKQDVINAYNYFEQWQTATGPISISFNDSDSAKTVVKFNQLPTPNATDTTAVVREDVIQNINYNTRFADISSSALTDTFDNMLNEIRGIAFTPLSGDNASGVADSITYKDPLGEYMELKNGSITVNGSVTGSDKTTFDMSVLLFGEMHGMVRAGVYDYQWNDKYMSTHDVGVHGQTPFPMGWYKGEDATTAYKPEKTKSDDSGSWPEKDPKTGTIYATAEEAWADGWVMRFDFQTLLDFVPIANAPTGGLPQNLDESVKNTTYTCYRFADSQADRNKLRRNPIFGDVPESLQKEWDDYFNANGSYPVGMGQYSDYTGVYRLSDIRVWSEHTGDFIDKTGSLTPEEEGGYDDALYVNIPVSATPTQLAEITLGPEGAISYKDNLKDKQQTTPFRLFYAVGLTEDLISRDAEGNQTGVDVSKISGEYIATHSDPVTGNISFISNWYSNTPYTGYASDNEEAYRTRGDAAASFSPNEKNRYYLFQKALPLIAHAYRVEDEEGNVTPVDNVSGTPWGENGEGNGKTTWERGQTGSNWSGGEFIGSYKDNESFQAALKNVTKEGDVRYIQDAKGYTYPLPENIQDAIITYLDDQLSKVDSEGNGYTSDSLSFSSDDYFFLCIEYYMPMEGTGVDVYGVPVEGTQAVCKVYRMIARKGSAFGSGLHSENIGNGDMLCWTDINGRCTIEIEYNSRSDTGDDTRGRPTLEKLTYTGDKLKTYLKDICHLNVEPKVGEQSYLDLDYAYWTGIQQDPHMAALIDEIKKASDPQKKFDELFDWSVATRTGGIRVGDMFNNMQAKGGGGDLTDGYYAGNKTKTANNYYIPTLSEKSTAGNGLVINNYLGNNGRMEIANVNLMATKTLVAPDGYTLTKAQQDELFAYQVYVQGLVGERLAQCLKWNPFSLSWQKRVESLDILTDNSSLLIDANGSRALFCCAEGAKPRQIVEVVEDNGEITYHYANADGTASGEICTDSREHFYYLYLPSNTSDESNLTYHLFASTYEDTVDLEGVGTTAYYPTGMDETLLPEGHNDNQTFAPEITGQENEQDDRPAGSREYWTKQAELIPYDEVQEAESVGTQGEGNPSTYAAQAAEEGNRWDHATNHGEYGSHKQLGQFTLVTVIPNPTGIDSTVYSPFSSRTQYMTVPLYFGYTAKLAEHLQECTGGGALADCQHLDEYRFNKDNPELYDSTIPTDTRSDLFNAAKHNTSPAAVANNTAEFTLKPGEGVLLTGLGNQITYRFTEKLTDSQIEEGYLLKGIDHVQGEKDDTAKVDSLKSAGVYSVFGDTDYTTEQSNYTNTVDPELFVLSKGLVNMDGKVITSQPDVEFTFTLHFDLTDVDTMTDMDSTLYYWKGDKDTWKSNKTWTDSGGKEYQMPPDVPTLNNYEEYLTDPDYRLTPIDPVDKEHPHTYEIRLKANEVVVFYGLIAGTKFTVTETKNDRYPVVAEGVADGYTKTGTILRASTNTVEINPKTTHNRAEFTNRMNSGILTVEKRIEGDEPDTAKDFTFTVTLTNEKEIQESDLKVTKYQANGTAYPSSDFTIGWKDVDGFLQAEFTLKHGERLVIEGIPLDTTYTVQETKTSGYNLQHVADNKGDAPDADGNYLTLTDNRVTGTITNSVDGMEAYLLFVNEIALLLPFVGGIGIGGIILTGILLIGLAAMLAGFQMRRRRRNARIGG